MSKARIQDPPLPMADAQHLSRRKFILQCSAAAAVAAVPTGLCLRSVMDRREVALDQLGLSRFAPLVGTHFHVGQDEATVMLELTEATAGGTHKSQSPATGGAEPEEFSLIFRGAAKAFLEQNSYPFAHEQIGRFVMFIVPVGVPDASGDQYYQAVFNRLAAAARQTPLTYG